VRAKQVDILSLETAVPDLTISQEEAQDRAKAYFKHLGYMEAVFANSGISNRHSCVPIDWFLQDHDWKERTELFHEHGLILLERVARAALKEAGVAPEDVGAVITVSSTGIAIPSLDATLANRIGLPLSVERLPIFGLGCAGGATALSRASRIAATMPGTPVLLLVLELCGINFRLRDLTKTNFVTTALFGDGAAGLVLMAGGEKKSKARVVGFGEHLWPDSEDVMGFTVETDGLGVVLRNDVPSFTRKNLRPVVDAFLDKQGVSLEEFEGFLFHPGGAKVLDGIETALELAPGQLSQSREVLNQYGNMSSPTVLFVLKKAFDEGRSGRHLLGAFGPGFFASLTILDLAA
jgi:alkylresorcinol/alkylpyrone synthase